MQVEIPVFDGATGEQKSTEWVEVPETPDPGTVQATVDVAAYDAAVARAKTATTVAGLRSAVLDLAAAITPG